MRVTADIATPFFCREPPAKACALLERSLAHVLAVAPALEALRASGAGATPGAAALERDADDALMRALREAARAATQAHASGSGGVGGGGGGGGSARAERTKAAFAAALRAKAAGAPLAERLADAAKLLAG
jgi:hypothetical protein